jgi:hypothetical protein
VGIPIGYSYRKLGDCKFSQVRARAESRSEPCTDVWQIEQGNRDQAQENAERPGIAAGPFFFFSALHGWT